MNSEKGEFLLKRVPEFAGLTFRLGGRDDDIAQIGVGPRRWVVRPREGQHIRGLVLAKEAPIQVLDSLIGSDHDRDLAGWDLKHVKYAFSSFEKGLPGVPDLMRRVDLQVDLRLHV